MNCNRNFNPLEAAINSLESVNPEVSTTENPLTIFDTRQANEVIDAAKNVPDPVRLFSPLWNEGEVSCLFADSNVGKSIYAVQIAESIAREHNRAVVYFDFEMSNKQFQQRYTDGSGQSYQFSPNLRRASIVAERTAAMADFETMLIQQIEAEMILNDAKVMIVDNITYLSSMTESAEAAAKLMMALLEMKRRHQWSILVLAHTPKRQLDQPITQNDLAGSKRLFNFFDSVFAIGRSVVDDSWRYVKQLKVRSGKFDYDSNSVLVHEILKEGAFLKFEPIATDVEQEHLKKRKNATPLSVKQDVAMALRCGTPIREIKATYHVSQRTIDRIKAEMIK